jgi:hypothetical protein
MKIFWVNPLTREFMGEGVANESPLQPGVFAIPADATTVPPPEASDGFVSIFVDNEWQQQPAPGTLIISEKEQRAIEEQNPIVVLSNRIDELTARLIALEKEIAEHK